MTSVLSPALPETSPHAHVPGNTGPMAKQATLDYLAGMLRELSVIAAWADLDRARRHIDAALHEIETKKSGGQIPLKNDATHGSTSSP